MGGVCWGGGGGRLTNPFCREGTRAWVQVLNEREEEKRLGDIALKKTNGLSC